ncbi:LPS-assembly protein LptD, partial [Bacteroidales bacterium OttesenSCG-928-C19]|nr:LPS-assembly protein LptD [Bacteroidales bacterium OttesenSCG-928-C19]
KDSINLLKKHPVSKNKVDAPVDYKAKDSISFDIKDKQAFLYQKGEILYETIELQADYVIVDFDKRELYAEGVPDSLGEIQGQPIFKDGESNYNSENLRYNFDSKKGIISHVITKEGEGFLHGDKVKKMNDSVMYLNSGRFTTCDLDHPHFAIEFSKSKLITGDRIVTSTAYLSIEDVPTPLIIPFGVFPFSQSRRSGILIPSYGWMKNRGYYLQRGGYYFAFNDYVDLELRGDIYTNSSWGVNANSNYHKRYKYKGNINLTFDKVKEGIKKTQTYSELDNFKIYWKHEQDPKANPRSRFSADVNFVSQSYGKYSTNTNDYLNNTTSSSINYSTKVGSNFNASLTLRESYNSQTKRYDFSLPEFRFYSNQIEPFKRKKQTGAPKWYEKIYFSYTMDMANKISSPDSLLFKKGWEKNLKNGISHSIPISYSTKVLKFFNWTNSITYNERWYLQSIEKQFDPAANKAVIDTVYGFKSNREASFSSSLSSQIYGMFNFKSNHVKALRHVVTPTLSFNYRPDFGKPDYGFWKSYYDTELKKHYYSIFENSLYGGPSQGESGNVNFSLKNNLEMKVRNKKDTITGMRKIMLIENLTLSMGYDLAKDSLNFSSLKVSGYTTLFKSLKITYSGSFSPYCIDSTGIYNKFLWKEDKKLFRKENASWQLGLNYSLSPSTFKKKKDDASGETEKPKPEYPIFSPFNNPNDILGTYVDFSVPWSLNINYTLNFVNKYVAKEFGYENTTIQTLNFSGDFSLTPNWKIGFSSGYDFELKDITYTSIDVYRDLHCWEMRFNWVPFGVRKSWNFSIAVKASMLKDALKYEMKQDFRDNENFYH